MNDIVNEFAQRVGKRIEEKVDDILNKKDFCGESCLERQISLALEASLIKEVRSYAKIVLDEERSKLNKIIRDKVNLILDEGINDLTITLNGDLYKKEDFCDEEEEEDEEC